MIELPEAVTIARQMQRTLLGRTFSNVQVALQRPRFLFVTPEPSEEFSARLSGHRIVSVTSKGKWIFTRLENDEILLIGEFGGRLLEHASESDLPKKRHMTFTFEDGSCLTLSIQMWGFVGALSQDEVDAHPYAGTLGPSPIDDDLTLERWNHLVDAYLESVNKPVKAFLTHEANICGIGNGYLQDILFRAELSPKRTVADLDLDRRAALFRAMREILERAIELGGRDTEVDLHGSPGRYVPLLDRRSKGTPCPRCGAPIEKVQYLGGSCYVCPICQA